MLKQFFLPLAVAGLVILLGMAMSQPNRLFWHSLEVTVTAYNSTRAQTDSTPNRAAWNNRLKPGMKVIAVSRDLISEGLTNQTEVYIEGFDEPYVVMDKMNSRFKRRIDIYFGKDVQAAREFGEQKAVIYWR
ncbi:3D domain-containing protein [Pseudodesulfovibrio sediminis]|uniref:Lipoprotein n=1 Tax=Pseudodesulfovibrio sediminis TaxID=2810563 RepID=A0ABM7P6Y3_9BACT|nr:3D domain-containing protein [Pseudodesulfovibrio sediminis]BCS88621.1 lipoprotein [Pseudodesulfovibrio sediminis]